MKVETKFWTMMSIFAVVIAAITLMLSSCASSKSCHTKGVYISKDVKRAQAKPKSY